MFGTGRKDTIATKHSERVAHHCTWWYIPLSHVLNILQSTYHQCKAYRNDIQEYAYEASNVTILKQNLLRDHRIKQYCRERGIHNISSASSPPGCAEMSGEKCKSHKCGLLSAVGNDPVLSSRVVFVHLFGLVVSAWPSGWSGQDFRSSGRRDWNSPGPGDKTSTQATKEYGDLLKQNNSPSPIFSYRPSLTGHGHAHSST